VMLIRSGAEGLISHGRIKKMNENQDLNCAKRELGERTLAFVIVKNKKILAESEERGVAPFFSAVTTVNAAGASLADKIVGKAVALLSAYSGIAAVYTPVVSTPAATVLQEYDILLEAEKEVPMILDRSREGQCPIEKMILSCNLPEEAYALLEKEFG
jgi:hypothetical protein